MGFISRYTHYKRHTFFTKNNETNHIENEKSQC